MKFSKHDFLFFLLLAMAVAGRAVVLPGGTAKGGPAPKGDTLRSSSAPQERPLRGEGDSIPDSLLHPRWKIQRTTPVTYDDLEQNAMDLRRPEGLRYEVSYNDSIDRYIIGTKIGSTYVAAPIMMTQEEYLKWSERHGRQSYYRAKNAENYQRKGKEKFDFTDMHFDLGPAEKLFGPGGVRLRTMGSAELRTGVTFKHIDNPSIPIRRRKTMAMDFDEKINLSVTGKVGDKINLGLNYNTDATFDFDAQNMKLKYDGKEDEIIKLIEGGNVSFPSNSSLIQGATSLFGIRTDLQFGKLKLQLVASQKKSSSKSVSSSGGKQTTTFELDAANYEENRHFFLSHFFRNHYDAWMKTLPTVRSGLNITRVEVWVTNKTGSTANTRDIIALTDLGENTQVANSMWTFNGTPAPSNTANTEYQTLATQYADARNIDRATATLQAAGLTGNSDFEKVESARLLSSSEYTVNRALGTISLNASLQTDQVLGVAYEYTYGGVTYQVGEFASDITDAGQALFVKSLKNTSNTPQQGNWALMMKNVYYLAASVEQEGFRLDVKYRSDTTGVYLTYLPEAQVKSTPLLRIIGADRLDNNNRAHANGFFDYVDGYTVEGGRVFLPQAEPFGSALYNYLVSHNVPADKASQYAFTELYDSTKTIARQIAEKDKYQLTGRFRGTSANVIALGAYNVPPGSVVVTAGGVTLTEGSDYSVDYTAGEVTILNQSILDAGTSVNVSLENAGDFSQERKTMFGMNWEYDFSKNFQLSGTLQHLSEQSLTTKVAMGSEPVSNTLVGFNLNWKHESQALTNLLDKLPGLHLTQPSQISFTGEFAKLFARQAGGTQDHASYLDDFESSTDKISILSPSQWVLSSVPSMFPEAADMTTLRGGYNRALLAWYTIDPLFTNRSSSLTPSHIKSDLEQLSNPYVRAVYSRELFPNRDINNYNGSTSTLSVLNLAYYPSEPGPYNFNPDMTTAGKLNHPTAHWGGMMRRLDTNDFETANIEYVEFWMMDPFMDITDSGSQDAGLGSGAERSGDLYINLGELSEDILHDGKKFYESGMPVDGSASYLTTQWGKVPTQATTTYAFATSDGSRALQDVGLNGLTDEEERTFESYQDYLSQLQGKVDAAVWDSIYHDPAHDDYHYFRGTDWDNLRASILRRYKYINNTEGNSPASDNRTESYDTSYKNTPDVEDINQDYTLNEYERYYQYHVSLRPEDFVVGRNFIVDKRETSPTLRNGKTEQIDWYLFRIPVEQYESKVGSISDFSSIRFMRMFLTNCPVPVILRLASFDLVRGTWRVYGQQLDGAAQTGEISTAAVTYEENNNKTPVNYVIPPGISQVQDPTQPQLTESDEQALQLNVATLSPGESKSVYKNTSLDIREYKHLQMFVHANALEPNTTLLDDNQLALFVRLGSDFKNNYYEYEIPLRLTPAGLYNNNSTVDRRQVWPEENMLYIPLSLLTTAKSERNRARSNGMASFTRAYSVYDADHPQNKVTVMGNPTLGDVKVMMIGVRNLSSSTKSGEVWINELRLLGQDSSGGWAAQGNLNVQLSDMGTVNVQGRYVSQGFGGLESGINDRTQNDESSFALTTSLELGKFFPDKAKVSIPLYYSITRDVSKPKYNPLDTDVRLKDALDAAASQVERDSIENIAVTKTIHTNFSLSNVRVGIATKRHPMPYDPANFSFSYSHSHEHTQGETTVYENNDQWRGGLNYNYAPSYKAWEPFKNLKSKSKWLDIVKRFGLNWLPQSIGFNTEMSRSYYELQERDLETMDNSSLPVTWNSQFLWNREFSLRWDFTRNMHMNFQSATNAEIEEPYTPVNKDLYPDRYDAWKDSVWQSIRHMGTPLDYQQTFSFSYQPPLQLLPVLNWVNANATYNATYHWVRGSEDEEDSVEVGNTINTTRELNITGAFDLVKLYNNIPFLKKANERFDRAAVRRNRNRPREPQATPSRQTAHRDGRLPTGGRDAGDRQAQRPKETSRYERNITLKPNATMVVTHNRKSRRLIVTAKTADGRPFDLDYKKVGTDKIKIINRRDTTLKLRLTVAAKPPLEDKGWYKAAQTLARVAMMVRSVNISYRNQYTLSLPNFRPMIGDAFGQTRIDNVLSPGLDFAFATVGDSYISKAYDRGWLVTDDGAATPATSNLTEDLQLKAVLEPVKDLKIDLTASRTLQTAKSIQYMYEGMPTTQSGTFNMTTIALSSAFEPMGNASNGYRSKTFDKFVSSLETFRQRVEQRYAGTVYPSGTALAGKSFDVANGAVDSYSADVMVPAFLKAYTVGGGSLRLFPALSKMLPNWTLRYSGLTRLPFFAGLFQSINLTHSYKCVYAVGAYQSYSTFVGLMGAGGDLGFITDATTGMPAPSSMYNISTVSINESFAPLLGIDVTFHNNLTASLQYRQTRVLSLSMTSIQIAEAVSKDWVVGVGYKVNDFNIFGRKTTKRLRSVADKTTGAATTQSTTRSDGVNRDLNLRFDFSFRKQASIIRDIATATSTASSGNNALRLSFSADYTLSRLLTLSFYLDRQTTTPLLTSSSYPTTTQDFGLSIKFSLTR